MIFFALAFALAFAFVFAPPTGCRRRGVFGSSETARSDLLGRSAGMPLMSSKGSIFCCFFFFAPTPRLTHMEMAVVASASLSMRRRADAAREGEVS